MVQAYFGLPEEVLFCKHCVISNQRPSSAVEFRHRPEEKKVTIGFDDDGVCDACRYHEVKEQQINWEKREQALIELLDKHIYLDPEIGFFVNLYEPDPLHGILARFALSF